MVYLKRNPKSPKEFRDSACDVYLRHQRDPQTVYLGHSLILNYYSQKLRLDLVDAQNRNQIASDARFIIDIPDSISQMALETLLEYFYTGNLAVDPTNVPFITEVHTDFYVCLFYIMF